MTFIEKIKIKNVRKTCILITTAMQSPCEFLIRGKYFFVSLLPSIERCTIPASCFLHKKTMFPTHGSRVVAAYFCSFHTHVFMAILAGATVVFWTCFQGMEQCVNFDIGQRGSSKVQLGSGFFRHKVRTYCDVACVVLWSLLWLHVRLLSKIKTMHFLITWPGESTHVYKNVNLVTHAHAGICWPWCSVMQIFQPLIQFFAENRAWVPTRGR